MAAWCRLWEDMPTDPTWRTIARKSGQRVGDVIAVFNFLMVNANANVAERGTLSSLVVEDVATALDIDEADVASILEAMQGRVLDGDRLTGWDRRQPKREDGTAAERKARWKEEQERRQHAEERIGTHRNAPEAEAEAEAEACIDDDVVDSRASAAGDVEAIDPDGTPSFARQCAEAAGIATASPRAIATVIDVTRTWLTSGAEPGEILTTIKQGVANATEPIHSLRYFDAAVRQAVARRRNGVAPTPRRPTGRRSGFIKYADDPPLFSDS